MADASEENTFKNISFLSTKDFPSGKIIEFSIEAAKDKKNEEIYKINELLVFLEDLSHGKIFKQQDSEDIWYINPTSTVARNISKARLDLLHAWDREPLLLSDEQFNVLSKIGGIPSSKYSMYPNYIQFPARVESLDGQKTDLCIFHFSKTPPFQRYFKKVLLLNNGLTIYPSDIALSHSLRLASDLAEEVRMSFAPFMIRTKNGKFITYNGTTQFASSGDIKGSDIDCQVKFSYANFDKERNIPFDKITFIIGKWDNRLEQLFNEYREVLERKVFTQPLKRKKWFQKLLGF